MCRISLYELIGAFNIYVDICCKERERQANLQEQGGKFFHDSQSAFNEEMAC